MPYQNLYDTLSDVVVITDPEITLGHRKSDINAAYFRSTMTVVDLMADAARYGTADRMPCGEAARLSSRRMSSRATSRRSSSR